MKTVFISNIKWSYLFNYFSNKPSLFRYYQDLVLKDCGTLFKGDVIELGGERKYNTGQFFPNASKLIVSNIDRDYDIYLDVTNLALEDNSVDNFVMVSMLQHVDEPVKAINEMHRTLKPGGLLILVNAFNHPLCDVRDYWRFTEDSYRQLLKDNFEYIALYKLGGKYSAFANTFQRPRSSKSPRILLNKVIGFFVALLGKVLEKEDFSPIGIGVLVRKIK